MLRVTCYVFYNMALIFDIETVGADFDKLDETTQDSLTRWAKRSAGDDEEKLNNLHAVLLNQCRIMGGHPYPYLLHRAHETAVVSLNEKEQLTRMILLELQRRGVETGQESHKQAMKWTKRRRR